MARGKLEGRAKRKLRIRKKVEGTAERPRLTIFRSNKQIYAQVIDDASGRTLASVSSTALYHGRVKALADGARKGGLNF
jgi:large subunit ribosomal protein L18